MFYTQTSSSPSQVHGKLKFLCSVNYVTFWIRLESFCSLCHVIKAKWFDWADSLRNMYRQLNFHWPKRHWELVWANWFPSVWSMWYRFSGNVYSCQGTLMRLLPWTAQLLPSPLQGRFSSSRLVHLFHQIPSRRKRKQEWRHGGSTRIFKTACRKDIPAGLRSSEYSLIDLSCQQ